MFDMVQLKDEEQNKKEKSIDSPQKRPFRFAVAGFPRLCHSYFIDCYSLIQSQCAAVRRRRKHSAKISFARLPGMPRSPMPPTGGWLSTSVHKRLKPLRKAFPHKRLKPVRAVKHGSIPVILSEGHCHNTARKVWQCCRSFGCRLLREQSTLRGTLDGVARCRR